MNIEEFQALLGIVDNILSLALLIALVILFLRGDVVSRPVVRDVITRTVQEVMDELRK